jgi:Holliday junction resolvase
MDWVRYFNYGFHIFTTNILARGDKLTSAKQKGNQRENQIAENLRQDGFTVMVSPRTMRKVGNKYYSSSNDYFGLFDICAKMKGMTRWIQVKSHMSDYYKCRKKLTQFNNELSSAGDIFEVWVRVKKNNLIRWRIFMLIDKFGWVETYTLNSKFKKI